MNCKCREIVACHASVSHRHVKLRTLLSGFITDRIPSTAVSGEGGRSGKVSSASTAELCSKVPFWVSTADGIRSQVSRFLAAGLGGSGGLGSWGG